MLPESIVLIVLLDVVKNIDNQDYILNYNDIVRLVF